MPLSQEKIEVFQTCEEMLHFSHKTRAAGKKIGFVPTMGALHDGHLSLVRQSQSDTDLTVVSIYVNPTQFAPEEDLSKYPRPFERDLELLQELGVTHVFAPSDDVMYPKMTVESETGYGGTLVHPPEVAKSFEGQRRPTHFQGVATIVLKLFNAVQPDIAYFGQKDFQQTLVVEQMVKDLNLPVKIQVCPIVREESGLALSSRNVYLSDSDKTQALAISQCLHEAENMIRAGQTRREVIENKMQAILQAADIQNIDYATVACAQTLGQPDEIKTPAVCLVAAYVGNTRLIDNIVIEKLT